MEKKMDAATAKMEANIAQNTGKTVGEWVEVVNKSGHEKHGQIVKFLKTEHEFTHGYANLVAHRALHSAADEHDDSDLIAVQYAGPKADLKPIFDRVMSIVEGFGSGFEAAPKKTYVSLRRKKQFGLVQASTRTRLDIGINLKGKEPTGRLEASGSFNSMVSHRVRITAADEVDGEVAGWLKAAFDQAG